MSGNNQPMNTEPEVAPDSWSAAVAGVRRGLPVLAWLAATITGIQASGQSDVLESTIRGAAVWAGTWVIGNVGITLAQQIIALSPNTITRTSESEGELTS